MLPCFTLVLLSVVNFANTSMKVITLHGNHPLRRRHFLGGRGSKKGQICRREGIGVKNRENLSPSLMDGP